MLFRSEQIATVRGPIGLDLGGKEPPETALAIMAEIVAARRSGSGLPMRERYAGPGGGAQPGQAAPAIASVAG